MENPYRAYSKVNPQKEGHHREIANDVFQALIGARLSGGEYQLVLTIIDRSWGFGKQSAPISLTKFEKATRLTRQGIIKAIKSCEAKQIIARQRLGRKMTEYLFNKHHDTWLLQAQLVNQSSLANPSPASQPEFTKLVNHSSLDQSTTVDQTSKLAERSSEASIETLIETSIETSKEKKPKKKTCFFDNILLTEEEYSKLVERFGESGTKDQLENLSLYKRSKGKRYASDYATVLAWARRDEREKGGRSGAHRRGARQLPQTYRSPEEVFGEEDG